MTQLLLLFGQALSVSVNDPEYLGAVPGTPSSIPGAPSWLRVHDIQGAPYVISQRRGVALSWLTLEWWYLYILSLTFVAIVFWISYRRIFTTMAFPPELVTALTEVMKGINDNLLEQNKMLKKKEDDSRGRSARKMTAAADRRGG